MSDSLTENNQPNSEKEILYVWDYLEWGGAQIYFFSLMRAARAKWSVRAVLPEKSARRMFDDLAKNKVEAIKIPAHTDASPAFGLKRKLERHWNKARSEQILLGYLKSLNLKNKILHLEIAPWHSFLLVRSLAKKARIVQTIHTPLPPVSAWRHFLWKTKLQTLSKRENYRLLASNQEAKESLKPFVPAEVFEKIEIAYSGINAEEIEEILQRKPSRAEIAAKYDLPERNLWVFCLGQFIERKGCWTFLEAAQKVKRAGENLSFVWITTNAPDAETEAKIENYDLGETFRLLNPNAFGAAARADLLTLVSHADIFVLASFQEGLPIALCEAMALEKACISTDVGAIPEAIKNRETGLLVSPGNAEMLAGAILELKRDAQLRDSLAHAGRDLVLAKFEEKKSAQTTMRVYEELWRLKDF